MFLLDSFLEAGSISALPGGTFVRVAGLISLRRGSWGPEVGREAARQPPRRRMTAPCARRCCTRRPIEHTVAATDYNRLATDRPAVCRKTIAHPLKAVRAYCALIGARKGTTKIPDEPAARRPCDKTRHGGSPKTTIYVPVPRGSTPD